MNPARLSTSKLMPSAFSLAVSALDIDLEDKMIWHKGKAIAGWFPLRSSKTGEMTDHRHYVEVRVGENVGTGHARCGMVNGSIEGSLFKRIFRTKCQKCKVSEQADMRAKQRAEARQTEQTRKILYGHS